MNYTLYDTRMAKASSSGGAVKKARNIKGPGRFYPFFPGSLMYQDVKQKQKAYEASETLYGAAKADKAAADRKKCPRNDEPPGIPPGGVHMAFQ